MKLALDEKFTDAQHEWDASEFKRACEAAEVAERVAAYKRLSAEVEGFLKQGFSLSGLIHVECVVPGVLPFGGVIIRRAEICPKPVKGAGRPLDDLAQAAIEELRTTGRPGPKFRMYQPRRVAVRGRDHPTS